jgi:hypothetical protein
MGPQQADRDDDGVREGDGSVEAAQFLRVLHAYSAIDHRTKRAKAVRAWPDGDIAGESAATNAAWSKLRAFVERVLRGEVPDPTRGKAWHWCSRRIAADHERAERAIAAGRLRRLRVTGLVNDYFAERSVKR